MHDGPTIEAGLIARCRTGDQEAFRQLVEHHHQHVYRTAYAITLDRAAASDVTQETFLKAWRGLTRFRQDASLATWLTRLALNAARDHQRRERVRVAPTVLRQLLPISVAEDEVLGQILDRDELREAIDRLAPPARQILALRYGRELTLDEIARTLACPVGTVKSRLHAASGQLRRALGREAERAPVKQGAE